jgi:hypothetical protein
LPLTRNARMGHVDDTGLIGPAPQRSKVNDMSNRRLAQTKTRPNAYEIPTWAIADAIRRRADKAKAVVRDDPEPPQRRDGVPVVVGPATIAFEGAQP